MNAMAVLELIQKGILAAELLYNAGKSAVPAFEAIYNLAKGGAEETLTQEQLDETSALLDQLIAEFNEPLPEG